MHELHKIEFNGLCAMAIWSKQLPRRPSQISVSTHSLQAELIHHALKRSSCQAYGFRLRSYRPMSTSTRDTIPQLILPVTRSKFAVAKDKNSHLPIFKHHLNTDEQANDDKD